MHNNIAIEVGSIIRYETFGGGSRIVEVNTVEADVKNGRPGFDGVVIAGPEKGTSVWGYDSQILEVIQA